MCAVGIELAQCAQRRRGHDGIAHPTGLDDQDLPGRRHGECSIAVGTPKLQNREPNWTVHDAGTLGTHRLRHVCEVKSGPAFHKCDGSALVAVMRRDGARAGLCAPSSRSTLVRQCAGAVSTIRRSTRFTWRRRRDLTWNTRARRGGGKAVLRRKAHRAQLCRVPAYYRGV